MDLDAAEIDVIKTTIDITQLLVGRWLLDVVVDAHDPARIVATDRHRDIIQQRIVAIKNGPVVCVSVQRICYDALMCTAQRRLAAAPIKVCFRTESISIK